jgi:hypothetical protein
MLLRPEVLGVIGLGIASFATLAISFRARMGDGVRPSVCPHCGTIQHNFSRTSALAHEFAGSGKCISCGKPLSGR